MTLKEEVLQWMPDRQAVAIYSILAIIWTWPAIFTNDLIGLHPDSLGTAWFISAAPRFFGTLHDSWTGWPEGVTYGRPDSFTLLVVSWLFQWLEPARLHALLAVGGVIVSALAADGLARALGARAPWSYIAGIAFSFGGLAATTLLEGYVYHLLDPWLPLLAWSWWRATSSSGTWQHGALAGVAFIATLLTTAYLAIAGALIVAALFIASVLLPVTDRLRWISANTNRQETEDDEEDEETALVVEPVATETNESGAELEAPPTMQPLAAPPWTTLQRAPLAAAAAVTLPLASVYLYFFLGAGGDAGFTEQHAGPIGQQLIQRALRLVGPTPITDFAEVSQSPSVAGTILALVIVSPAVLRDKPGWRPIALTGLVALLLTLTPRIDPQAFAWGPAILTKAISFLGASVLRFPERLAWGWQLCGGAVAALVLTELGSRRPKAALWLLVAALVDAFIIIDMPGRQGVREGDIPSAYLASEGPVLDFYPEDVGPTPRWTLRTTNTPCYYQSVHGRPIADHCMFTHGIDSPRVILGRWLALQLLQGKSESVSTDLQQLGFTTIAYHADFFLEGDRTRLANALFAIDANPTVSTDGGEHVMAFNIPADPSADPKNAWLTWHQTWVGGSREP